MSAASRQLRTQRLLLQAPDATPGYAQVAAVDEVVAVAVVVDFYRRNAAHFAPWDLPLPPDQTEPARVQSALAEGAEAFVAGRPGAALVAASSG